MVQQFYLLLLNLLVFYFGYEFALWLPLFLKIVK